jgi:LysR family transcriptional regulator, hca operon transcriptional activator
LTIHSASSLELARRVRDGKIDLAFLRQDDAEKDLAFRTVAQESLFVLLPANHALAKRCTIRPDDIAGETFINFPKSYAPALRRVIDAYFARVGIHPAATHEAETLPVVISLVLSTGGVSLLPTYAERLLPPSVVARQLHGEAPRIALVVGYREKNTTPVLKQVLAAFVQEVR